MYNVNMSRKELKNAKKDEINANKGVKTSKFTKFMFVLLFLIFLPLLIIIKIIRLISKRIKYKKWEREGKKGKVLLMQSNISDIDIMEGYEFENYLATLFFYEGFSVDVTPKSKDFGADIILTDGAGKIVVQAKRYSKSLGIKCVQEVVSAIKHYKATNGVVITNSHFTEAAETLAKDNNIRLIDREELIEMFTAVKRKLKIKIKENGVVDKTDERFENKFPYMI